MEPLPATVEHRDGWTVVSATGPLDVATSPALRQRLTELQVPAGTRLVLDLEGVEHIDSFGLAVLIGALKRARSSGGSLVVRCTRQRTLSLLALTRLDEVLDVVAELSDLDGLEPDPGV
ncbi:MAG: STAS domain-containing protein [Actinobacteria bacterium]|nr:STAS domain-containing protein [Actinomycetota bacterium]